MMLLILQYSNVFEMNPNGDNMWQLPSLEVDKLEDSMFRDNSDTKGLDITSGDSSTSEEEEEVILTNEEFTLSR